MNKPVHVSDTEFEDKVLNSELPDIVDSWVLRCGHCEMIAPVLEEIAKMHDDKLVVAKVNTDENLEWACSEYPPILFLDYGEVIHRLVGAALPLVIKDKTESLLMDAQKFHEWSDLIPTSI